jgi:hypothetical protein
MCRERKVGGRGLKRERVDEEKDKESVPASKGECDWENSAGMTREAPEQRAKSEGL